MSASWEIRQGDVLDRLREMPAESVDCCITSPPYFGLRDYGTGEWGGGDPECDHVKGELRRGVNLAQSIHSTRGGAKKIAEAGTILYGDVCGKCGAARVDKQIGLEATPDEYVAKLVAVFAEVKRVLRDGGTLWLNLGDSYNNRAVNRPSSHQAGLGFESEHLSKSWRENAADGRARMSINDGDLKEKDLLGIPWMVAFALRADGWYLRSEIIWAKPNPMPESVTDRPTKAHEQVFLLARSPRYYYDAKAIQERVSGTAHVRSKNGTPNPKAAAFSGSEALRPKQNASMAAAINGLVDVRNKRSVWEVGSKPYAEAHYATFSPKLVEPMVLAGCPAGGVILDPFAGSGTTLQVAVERGRSAIGIELSPDSVALAEKRMGGVTAPLFADELGPGT